MILWFIYKLCVLCAIFEISAVKILTAKVAELFAKNAKDEFLIYSKIILHLLIPLMLFWHSHYSGLTPAIFHNF
jgi:hypothetical protein